MKSISVFMQKIKSLRNIINSRDDIFISIIIILVGLGSFGLGRLSVVEDSRVGGSIKITSPVQENINTNNLSSSVILSDKKYVASKNGTKYHAPWCSGAKRIKEGNKIWFSSLKEARGAGYTPAKNCKGLE